MQEQGTARLGSFLPEDVTLLLKDVTGLVEERAAGERETRIQNGRHYSEDLPVEKPPAPEYMRIYDRLLDENCERVALYTGALTRLVLQTYPHPVFVSLVRAGVPCGVLMRRYAARVLGRDVPHYGVSIIRGKGFDANALRTVLRENPGCTPVFVDGWTGKGMITRQLAESCDAFNRENGTEVRPILAVLSDPAHSAELYATREDFINPSCCLNSTVCGLISRTVHNLRIIGPDDYHGVRVYREFAALDVTKDYLDRVTADFERTTEQAVRLARELFAADRSPDWSGMQAVLRIGERYGVNDINRIKPSIGETTRVLLRRVPDRVLLADPESPETAHIRYLAAQKGVPVEAFAQMPYVCCGLISNRKKAEI